MTKEIYLFVDSSVNPQEKIAYGAYLLIQKNDFNAEVNVLNKLIKTKRFDNTSSTKAEIQALLWAFEKNDLSSYKINIFTDCQNIIGLEKRREKLEKNNYLTKTNKEVKNHLLYKEFFKYTSILNTEFIKVKGHKKSSLKNDIDTIFSLIDKKARNTLREEFLK